jgi:thiaminase/transcriptional activator TenA
LSRFTDRMWAEIGPLYGKILAQPFNRALADGSLERETFVFYMIQDAHYLGMFSRALAATAARAPTPEGQAKLSKSAHDAIIVERALHEGFFTEFGVDAATFLGTPPSPTCRAYGDFLMASAHVRPYSAAVSALLPCFQIYYEVGKHLLGIAAKPHPYQRWIDTYADEAFGDSVREMLALTDIAHDAGPAGLRAEMRETYLTACRYEWMFWDSAWRREGWPI